MEEDNVGDIVRWMFKESTKPDCESNIKLVQDDFRSSMWEARLRGNLLALKSLDLVVEPQLYVCEKLNIAKVANLPNSLCIILGNKEITVTFPSEPDLDKWMLKLTTCSHRIVQAEYDRTLYTHFLAPNTSRGAAVPRHLSYFLDSPYSKEQCFSIFQFKSANIPNRQIVCCETMLESKFSFLVPREMLKLSLKWTTELRDELLDKLWSVRNTSIVEALHTIVRHLNSNIEVYTQACEFLDSYSGPSFRPSTEKYRISFLYVPTNLHVQSFSINDKRVFYFLTAGALAALPLRFSAGGLYRLRNHFYSKLNANSNDYMNEARFYARRQTLQTIKRTIGDLSRRIENWNLAHSDETSNICIIQILSEAKQIYESIADLITSFPNIHNLVDSLCEGGLAQMQHKGEESVPRDTLGSQLEYLEAHFVSLNSKLAAIDRFEQDAKAMKDCEANLRSGIHSVLNGLHHLSLSLLLAQLLSFVQPLRNNNDCQTFFQIQLRHDALLSQAISIALTALLTALHDPDKDLHTLWEVSHPAIITCFSFLSCYGDEQGMLEDSFEMWQLFHALVSFRFVPIVSSIAQICVPLIEGNRTKLKISIPLPSEKLKCLPERFVLGEFFSPKVFFWNLGINHEASLAASVGDISLEENVNRTAARQVQELVSSLDASKQPNYELIVNLCTELLSTISANASRKNTQIFPSAMALNNALGGHCILSCKSGKDRTGMAVTLEEGRILKETCAISNQQVQEIVECLRKNGVRRENCRKNTGKPIYSFSPFQMNFLPKEFRPPLGTFSNRVSS